MLRCSSFLLQAAKNSRLLGRDEHNRYVFFRTLTWPGERNQLESFNGLKKRKVVSYSYVKGGLECKESKKFVRYFKKLVTFSLIFCHFQIGTYSQIWKGNTKRIISGGKKTTKTWQLGYVCWGRRVFEAQKLKINPTLPLIVSGHASNLN